MSNQNVIVRIDAKPAGDLAKPFGDMGKAAGTADKMVKDLMKSSQGFDGITKSIRLSQEAMDKFAASAKAGADAQNRLAKTGTAATGKKDEAYFGSYKAEGFNQTLEVFAKIASAGKDVVALFDFLGGKQDALKNAGFLGQTAHSVAQSFEGFTYQMAGGDSNASLAGPGGGGGMMNRVAGRRQAAMDMQVGEEAEFRRIFIRQQQAAGLESAEQAAMLGDQAAGGGEAAILARERARRRAAAQQMEAPVAGLRTDGSNRGVQLGNVADQLKFAEDAQNRLVESEKKQLDLIRKSGQERVDKLKQALDLKSSELDKAKAVSEAEKGKLEGFQAEFGRLDPAMQQAAKEMALKVKKGGKLEGAELEIARGMGFFGEQVFKQDLSAGGKGGFADLAKNLGLDLKLKESQAQEKALVEAKIDIQNKITAEIKLNESALADQVNKVLIPELHKAIQLSQQRIKAEMEKANFFRTQAKKAAE